MRIGLFVDGTFIPERDGASTRFARLPGHLVNHGTPVTAFHCYRGWSDLDQIAAQPFTTHFFPPGVFYNDLDCLTRLAKAAGVTVIQMNDAETVLRIGCTLAHSLSAHLVYEAHYHTSTLASSLGAPNDRVAVLRLMEAEVCQRADHLIVFTEADRQRWISLSGAPGDRVSIVPFGVAQASRPKAATHRAGVAFIGNLFYEPNRRAVQRIVDTILPAIRAARPNTPALVIGAAPADLSTSCAAAGITLPGEVPDPLPLLSGAAVGLAPVSEGSGVRVKILQYLAAGLPVVATPVAAEGLRFAALFEEDDNSAIATRCVHILQHPEHYAPLVRDTLTSLQDHFHWSGVAQAAGRVYSTIVARPRRNDEAQPQTMPYGLPIWLDEVLTKGRFAGEDAAGLGAYRFGTAQAGGVTTFR